MLVILETLIVYVHGTNVEINSQNLSQKRNLIRDKAIREL